jgi:hypothetical protein
VGVVGYIQPDELQEMRSPTATSMWSLLLVCLSVSLVIARSPVGQKKSFSTTLDNVVNELIDPHFSAVQESGSRGESNSNMYKLARITRSSSYSPFMSNPYDLGPVGQCSSPQLDICDFPDNYIVPEYAARYFYYLYNDRYNDLKYQLELLDGSRCAESMANFTCREVIAPRCISETMVRYPSNFLSKCQRAISPCVRFLSAYPTYCSNFARNHLVGDFSLFQCRVPQVSDCANLGLSPDWLAAQMELRASLKSFEVAAKELNMSGACKESFIRLSCTTPTCEPNGRLQGYRNTSQCNDVLNWFVSIVTGCAYMITYIVVCN